MTARIAAGAVPGGGDPPGRVRDGPRPRRLLRRRRRQRPVRQVPAARPDPQPGPADDPQPLRHQGAAPGQTGRPGRASSRPATRWTPATPPPAGRCTTLGDLLAAIRLPNGAHQRLAGTQVVTDVLLFRRAPPDACRADRSTGRRTAVVDVDGVEVRVNDWFAAGRPGDGGRRADGRARHVRRRRADGRPRPPAGTDVALAPHRRATRHDASPAMLRPGARRRRPPPAPVTVDGHELRRR